jgi:hypothetical protein
MAVQLAALCIGVEAKKSIKINSQGEWIMAGLATKIAGASQEEAFVAGSTGSLFEGVEASQNVGIACHCVRKV